MTYHLTITTTSGSASIRIAGDVDYETADDLVEAASQLLTQQDALSDLHLDFSEMTFLDSAALSGLLLVHRRAAQAGVTLQLDHRPTFLDRVLQVTGLYGHFVPEEDGAGDVDSNLLEKASSGESGVR